MRLFIAFVALAGVSTSAAGRVPLVINTPAEALQCVPTELTFQGGPGPFSLVISTPDANGQTLQTFDGITSSPFTWATNIRAGTQVGVSLTDVSTGSVALSGSFTVGDSGDSSCLA